ncbi:IclR family transcriptional regulator [Halorubrum sp. 48-1-W]|uniref:IclR family transcriptional regulator n=1 Tax=Halorubrum sp. 48-1-W TaxID=2249761 RepID=UPI000DCD529C|nr:IclR family transcriptional regulator [Halorubrum sp. 48-1-W]RAW44980.1 IclR family transcriptional regulator [Halorubrum sp. 48-1-W]
MATAPPEYDGPIQAVERSMAIVEEIRRRDGAGVTELADHFGFSKSTVHDHVTTLERAGYLAREGDEYHVGLRFLTLGGHARQRQELYELAKSEVDDLAEETGESAKFVVEDRGRGIYLYQSLGDNAIRTDSHVGTRVYLHANSVGKAILANLPEDRVERILDRHGMPRWTEHTITDRDELYEELRDIRDRGVAFDDEERIRGLRCVAAPVIRDGDVLGSISVSGPTKRFDEQDYMDRMAELVRSTARVIEINAKYT